MSEINTEEYEDGDPVGCIDEGQIKVMAISAVLGIVITLGIIGVLAIILNDIWTHLSYLLA